MSSDDNTTETAPPTDLAGDVVWSWRKEQFMRLRLSGWAVFNEVEAEMLADSTADLGLARRLVAGTVAPDVLRRILL